METEPPPNPKSFMICRRFCRCLLALAALLASLPAARSDVLLTFNANADYSVVTATLSGSVPVPDGYTYPYLYSNILVDGLVSGDMNAVASSSTLKLAASAGGPVNYNTLAYMTDVNAIADTYLTYSSGPTTTTGPYTFSGSATFNLSAYADELGGLTSGDVLGFVSLGDDGYDTFTIGSWVLDVDEAPEPGTVALACAGLGLAACVLRRRLVFA